MTSGSRSRDRRDIPWVLSARCRCRASNRSRASPPSVNTLWEDSLTRWYWLVGLSGATTLALGFVLAILVGMGVLEFTFWALPMTAAVLGPNSLLFLAGRHLFRRFTLLISDGHSHANGR